MLTVGLTGGYASGKTTVAKELERLGCYLIYADKLGYQALQPTGEAYGPTLQAFGPEILKPDGTINRSKLGAIVFASPEKLALLNSIVHPAVYRIQDQLLQELAEEHPHRIAVVEAAILIETGRYKIYDRLIVTACSEQLQIARAMARDGLTEKQVRTRLRSQLPVADKRAFAHYVIDTDGTTPETLEQVAAVYTDLRRLA